MPDVPGIFTPKPLAGLTGADFMFGTGVPDDGFTPLRSLSPNLVPRIDAPAGMAGPGMGSGFGLNLPTAQAALGGLGTIGQLWAGFQAAHLAKKQFSFNKGVANANLANQIQSYNTQLSDRARSRAVVEGQTPAQTQSYLDQNSLKPKTL